MPSETTSKRPSVSRVVLALVAAGIVGGSLFFILPACKPDEPPVSHVGTETQIPADSVALYFNKYQGSQSIVESVVRKLPEDAKQEPVRYAVTELLKGPTSEEKAQGFYSEIPQGTKLLGIKTSGDKLTVDLSSEFQGGGGSTTITQRVEELKQTVYAVDHQHELVLSVEGEPLELLSGEGLEVPGTLQREQQ